MSTFNAFVVDCGAIANHEVFRLRNLGARGAEVEDARQEGLLALLEAGPEVPRDVALARIIIRRHLLNVFVERPHALKRTASLVPIDVIMGEDGDGHTEDATVPRSREPTPSVPSHEDLVVTRLTAAAILREMPPPTTTATTRQGRQQVTCRWLRRVREAFA